MVNEETKMRAIELIKEGLSVRVVMDRLGISLSMFYRLRKQAELDIVEVDTIGVHQCPVCGLEIGTSDCVVCGTTEAVVENCDWDIAHVVARLEIHLRRGEFEQCKDIINDVEDKEQRKGDYKYTTIAEVSGVSLRIKNYLESLGYVYLTDLNSVTLKDLPGKKGIYRLELMGALKILKGKIVNEGLTHLIDNYSPEQRS